jgi:hypothetical protein
MSFIVATITNKANIFLQWDFQPLTRLKAPEDSVSHTNKFTLEMAPGMIYYHTGGDKNAGSKNCNYN